MKKIAVFLGLLLVFSCGTSKNTSDGPSNLQANLDKKNRASISLLNQIRQKPGIILKNGVPALQKTDNNVSFGHQEPLYVLDGLILSNSFASVNDLVDNYMVKKIEIISGADASFYGSRGASGVIKITTYTGEEDKAKNN